MYLEAADQGIHLGPQSDESLERAVQSLLLAKRELAPLSGEDYEQAVERYIDWRLGEAHLFLGRRRDDPDQFRLARADFSRAYGREVTNYYLDGSPLPPTLLARIAHLKPHHPPGGRALAHEALAAYEWPRTHLERAVELRKASLVAWAGPDAPGHDPFAVAKPAPYLFHDCGRDLVELGHLVEDPAVVAEGLKYLLHVDDEGYWPTADHLGRAAFLESVGRARWAEAELGGDWSKYELAEQRMHRAMAVRSGDAPVAQANTRLILANVALSWAARDADARPEQLALARLQTTMALQAVVAADYTKGITDARLLLARIELADGHTDAARELISALAGNMAGVQRPVLRAEMSLVEAELAARTCQGSADVLTALRDLLAEDNPRQHRRAAALLERLESCPDRR